LKAIRVGCKALNFLVALNVLLILLILASSEARAKEAAVQNQSMPKPKLMLARTYKEEKHKIDVRQYWVSEKYDGVRAYWNGQQLLSRQGKLIHAPAWFIQGLPSFQLDGELWLGRNTFDQLSAIVRKKQAIDEEWKQVRYMVFDLPASSEIFSQRLLQLQAHSEFPTWVSVAPQWRVANEDILLSQLQDFLSLKAEGLMLHNGQSLYTGKRTNDLLKLKASLDAEARVLSYVAGKGKYLNQMGAIWVEAMIKNEQGVGQKQVFKIGSGFSDDERRVPPAIGSMISFKYSGLTSKGKPRFPRFWRLYRE
jgi:DNA ligase-1